MTIIEQLRPNFRRARKQHQCECCRLDIQPGTTYNYERLTPWTSGDAHCWGHWRLHVACAVEYYVGEVDWWDVDYTWPDGEFRESLLRRWGQYLRGLGIEPSEHPESDCPRRLERWRRGAAAA